MLQRPRSLPFCIVVSSGWPEEVQLPEPLGKHFQEVVVGQKDRRERESGDDWGQSSFDVLETTQNHNTSKPHSNVTLLDQGSGTYIVNSVSVYWIFITHPVPY